jgi:hypothetical protein
MPADCDSDYLHVTERERYSVRGLAYAILVYSILFLILLVNYGCSKENGDSPIPVTGDLVEIRGSVKDENGPVGGATVRLKTTGHYTLSDEEGNFKLQFLLDETPCIITAWAEGYYIAGGFECRSGDTAIALYLEPYSIEDNPNYQWVSAYSSAGNPGNCENCHSSPSSDENLPFDEWRKDAHAHSAENIRFLTMYSGTDIYGKQSPLTVYVSHPEYGSTPLLPDPDLAYYGPGYQLDFPNTAGNCAACHAPMASINNPYGTSPVSLEGVHKEGISCDFCHKIVGVKLDQQSGAPAENMPGVISYVYGRPFDGHQFFAGPFDDVSPGEDTYSPVQKESRYCAPCHFGSFWGVQIYNSYGEWLESPYSEGPGKLTCQDCHMPKGLTNHFTLLDKGGSIRDPESIGSHRMLGIKDEEFMRNAVALDVQTLSQDSMLTVTIKINNDNTGHHIPTDSPLRHLILVVDARDEQGNTLEQIAGPTLPDWCGKGDPSEGYVAGLPGMVYAKILKEHWTEKVPTGSYWMQTRIVSDNRIKALDTASSEYSFKSRLSGSVHVTVRLIYRRAFIELSDQKGWDREDIILFQKTLDL